MLRHLLIAFVALAPTFAVAQDPIRFARTPDISADGKLLAFSYLGDIWTVEAIGGVARPVTMHEAHDLYPCISPDGRQIAFSSNRHGSYDVFVVAVHGGRPKRLTFDSGMDVVNGWTPDGKNIVFSSTRSSNYPIGQDVYTVSVDGGQEKRLNLFEAKEAYFSPTGNHVAFVRGPGLWYRKGYHGSSNDDIWISAADGSNARKLTTFDGQDTSPMWSPDGKKVFYVSETADKPGFANIVVQDVQPDSAALATSLPKALTAHGEDFVRRARISKNGDWIVYECGADLFVVNTHTGQSRKLAIEVHADDKSNTERTVTYTRDATEFALSPDESHAVIVVHGELFLTKVPTGGKATRLTDTTAFDSSPVWSPDGKKIVFTSDRTGVTDLYLLEPDDAENPELTKAHKFKTTRLTDTTEDETGVGFSPKGDLITFLRGGKLWSMKPDGSDAKIVVDDLQVMDYDWSPDGKYLVYAKMDGSFASEIFIKPLDGSHPPRNVTRYATFNGDVTWSNTGGKVAFLSQRRGNYSMHVLSLYKPTADGSTPSRTAEPDWDDIHQRVERVSSTTAEGGSISPDGTQVAFRSLSSGDDLWVAGSDGRSVTRLTTGSQSPHGIRWSKRAGGMIYFLNGMGELRGVRSSGSATPSALSSVFGSSSSEPMRVPFSAKMTINRDEEFQEMYAQSWRTLSDYFYDTKHHGADWKKVRAKYADLVPHVAQREDLYSLISLMLGELNASHLGISGRMPVPDEVTADLGLIFDETFAGPGLKIAEVLKRGPADKRGQNLKAGDVLLSIDRTTLSDKTNLSQLLNNKVGETVLLDVADGKDKRRVEVKAESRVRISDLMYERWVDNNAAQIAKESNGKVGYIHIPSMDEAGLEIFVRSLYSDNFDKEAIVLDVRNNGGGFTHDQVLAYLVGKEHTMFRQRNGGEGWVMRSYDRKWSKPVSLLINNRSYSDAEIFPHAFRSIGLGKVVGQATGGHVIGTYQIRLIDGSSFRVPRTGVFTTKGVNMEKEGVQPDIAVEQSFADWQKGHDTQLTEALKTVQTDVVAWKKAKGMPVAAAEPLVKPATNKPEAPPVAVPPTKASAPAVKTGN
ncbi:S41 family peptidase [Limnoglobus roseus]|uniref:Tricorn protease homolog n=1 Tax=Limnoglobus roseus TaxID=2598579 RepID=A0A5C1AFH1_9BACT|nr:S41 family peptidase [Limnoglobus roseus]QEL17325.1 PDZ domain-containing protein [Limnoglobus roseus]